MNSATAHTTCLVCIHTVHLIIGEGTPIAFSVWIPARSKSPVRGAELVFDVHGAPFGITVFPTRRPILARVWQRCWHCCSDCSGYWLDSATAHATRLNCIHAVHFIIGEGTPSVIVFFMVYPLVASVEIPASSKPTVRGAVLLFSILGARRTTAVFPTWGPILALFPRCWHCSCAC